MSRSFQTTLAAQYSTVFATGLLARSSLEHDDDDTANGARTPTPSNPHTSEPTHSAAHANQRRALRKRRSSLTTASSPVPALKTHVAHTRPSFLSRARSGSLSDALFGSSENTAPGPAPATTGNNQGTQMTLVNRVRSGSLGGALRAGARRLVRKAPTAPPSVPLPPLPLSVPGASYPSPVSAPPTQVTFAAPPARRPLAPVRTSSGLAIQIAFADSSPTGEFKISDVSVFGTPPLTPVDVNMRFD